MLIDVSEIVIKAGKRILIGNINGGDLSALQRQKGSVWFDIISWSIYQDNASGNRFPGRYKL